MKLTRTLVVCAALGSLPAMAQKWEFGAGAGGGFYTASDITSAAGTAKAKIGTNLAASAWVGNNKAGKWGGEFRYDYQRGPLQLKQGSTEASFGAESHAIHYDFLYHFAESEAPVRPFVAVGGGLKAYRGTGEEALFQPLSKIALLTKAQDLTAMVSVGAGFKMQLSRRTQLRIDVHDYMTPFPKQVITPAVGATGGSWIHDIVPMVGISFTN